MSNRSPSLDIRSQLPTIAPALRNWLLPTSWRRLIANSGLPDDIQSLLTTVIRKSRLLGFEKAQVVDELICHFVDGNAAGKSYASLVANFGDVSTTASLIRNSKIRNRPIMFKILQIMGWGILAITSAYLAVWGYFQSGHPTPTIDYMPAFNEYVEDVDANDSAWPIYRPVFTKFGFSEGAEFHKKLDVLYVDEEAEDEWGRRNRRRVTPDDPQWQQVKQRLDELSELLNMFRQASSKSRMGLRLQTDETKYSAEDYAALFPNSGKQFDHAGYIDDNSTQQSSALLDDSVLAILLPHVQSFRTGARLMHFDNLYAIEQGDSERVTQNLIAHFGMARHAADCNCLVGALVGFAVARMGFEEIDNMLAHPDLLSSDQLQRIQQVVEDFRVGDLVKFDGERAMTKDIIQRVFTDDGNGDGRITPAGLKILHSSLGSRNERWAKEFPEFETILDVAQFLSEPAAMFMNRGRKETVERYEAVMDIIEEDFEKPAWEAKIYDADKMLGSFDRSHMNNYLALYHLLPAAQQIQDTMYRIMATQEAAILAIAAHRYRLTNGNWPESIDSMTPEFVVETPIDLFDGNALRFLIDENDQLIAYSVWHDGDDDNATPATYQYKTNDGNYSAPQELDGRVTFSRRTTNRYEGDLIVWPPLSTSNR